MLNIRHFIGFSLLRSLFFKEGKELEEMKQKMGGKIFIFLLYLQECACDANEGTTVPLLLVGCCSGPASVRALSFGSRVNQNPMGSDI